MRTSRGEIFQEVLLSLSLSLSPRLREKTRFCGADKERVPGVGQVGIDVPARAGAWISMRRRPSTQEMRSGSSFCLRFHETRASRRFKTRRLRQTLSKRERERERVSLGRSFSSVVLVESRLSLSLSLSLSVE